MKASASGASRRSRLFPRPVAAVCLVLLVVQVALIAWLVQRTSSPEPHDVPLRVVAPAVVAQGVAQRSDALEGHPFEAVPVSSASAARSDVRDGSAVAAIEIDLTGTADVAVLNDARDVELNQAVLQRIGTVEQSYGRTVTVTWVRAPTVAEQAPGRLADAAYGLTFTAGTLALLMVVFVSVRFGPVARSLLGGVRRLLRVGGAAVAAGLLLSLVAGVLPGLEVPVHTWRLALVCALTVTTAAVTTLALESVFALAGLGLSAVVLGLASVPLLTRTDPYLLPPLWQALTPWTPPGAAQEAMSTLTQFGGRSWRALLVLAAWSVVAIAAMLVARRLRARYGVVFPAAPGSRPEEAVPAPGPVHLTGRRRHPLWRLRVAAVVVPVAAALLLAVWLVPPGDVVAVSPLVSTASESRCVSTGQVRSVADLNRIAGELRGGSDFQGGDVGADVLLQDGRRLWVFGDTLRGPGLRGQQLVRNSMLVLGPDCIRLVLPADHGALIPDRPRRAGEDRSVGYWPMSLSRVERPGYDLVSVQTQRVRSTGSDAFDFENLGTSIAIFVVPRGGTPQLVTQRDIGADDPGRHRPTWGAAAAQVGRWLYLYGTASPEVDQVFGFSLRVARVRPEHILEPSAWRYWDGRRWVRDAARAQELIPAADGVSQTLSVFAQGDRWYVLSKRNDFLGRDLTVWSGYSPTGPFSDPQPLAALPSDTATGRLRYMPLAHPDLLPEPGTVVVSYSRNDTDLGEVLEDPLLYRPRFLRVRLPR